MLNWFRKLFRGSKGPASPAPPSVDNDQDFHADMRGMALGITRKKAGIPTPSPDAPIWGMLMETGYPRATATIFALADGTTSLYLSTGGGVIGGHRHETVRQANAAFFAVANRMRERLEPTTWFPLPELGRTVFYALTDAGVLSAQGLEEDMAYGRHALSELFDAGQEVLTQLRLITQKNEPELDPATVSPEDIQALMVKLDIGGEPSLFVMLTSEGGINRLGTGTANNAERDMFIGKVGPDLFQQLRAKVSSGLLGWCGQQRVDPHPEGALCELTVGFQIPGGRELLTAWRYGSESQGPPPEVGQFVVAAVHATEPWFQQQKAMARKG